MTSHCMSSLCEKKGRNAITLTKRNQHGCFLRVLWELSRIKRGQSLKYVSGERDKEGMGLPSSHQEAEHLSEGKEETWEYFHSMRR